jgi:hypothetical protein
VGFRTIHNRNTYNIPVNNNNGLFADPNGTGGANNNRTTWFNRLFNAAGSGRTPLHNALNSAGSYFELTDASGPWGPTGRRQPVGLPAELRHPHDGWLLE